MILCSVQKVFGNQISFFPPTKISPILFVAIFSYKRSFKPGLQSGYEKLPEEEEKNT